MTNTASPAPTLFIRKLLKHMVNEASLAGEGRGSASHKSPTNIELLYAARFAATLQNPERVLALSSPMTLTMINAAPVFDREIFAEHSEFILACMSDICDTNLMTNVGVVFAPGPRQSDGKRALDRFHRELNSQIAQGASIIALVADVDDLSEAASVLPRAELQLSPITGTIISEVMRASSQAPSRHLTDLLRARDPQIAGLPHSVVLGALKQAAPGDVVRTLLAAVDRHNQPPDGPSLDSLELPPDLRRHLTGIIADITDYRDGKTAWKDVCVSTLLHGPPGCGKTSIAQAMAVSARLHFVSASFSECQSAGNLSDFLKALENRVSEAIQRAPSLIFMDELDSYRSRSDDHGRNDTYMQLVINALLQVLSRLNNTPGVLVMAATNYPDHIDPAIVRSGRFDTHVFVGPPDRVGVEGILRKRFGQKSQNLDLTPAVDALTGLSGADISTAATKALAVARRAKRDLQLPDIMAEVDRLVPASFTKHIWRIAVHEAGHAIARVSLGMPPPTHVLLSPKSSYVAGDGPGLLRLDDAKAMIAVFLAGRAAEQHVFGDTSSGAEDDLRKATDLALFAECRGGLTSDKTLYLHYLAERPETWPSHVHGALRSMVETAGKLAGQAVAHNEAALLAFASALQTERELTGARLARLLENVTALPLQPQHDGTTGPDVGSKSCPVIKAQRPLIPAPHRPP